MAVFHSPRIPTNGLVFAVDPANPKSYSGSGTSWIDLSESRNNATLQNTPTFNSANNQGTFSFASASSQRASFAYTNLPTGSSAGTLCGWAKTTTVVGSGYVISYGTGSQYSWRGLARIGSTFYFSGFGSDVLGGTITTNTWNFWSGIYDGTNAALYIDTALIQSAARSWTTGTSGTPNIGASPSSSDFWSGEISECLIYNRALSVEELLQIYNATRGRFGK